MLYFAYGSNMGSGQMAARCPACRFRGTARLEGFRFVYDGYSVSRDGAVGNIVRSDAERVWGALYEITETDRLALDASEGYPRSYDRRDVEVTGPPGGPVRAMTYFRTGRATGQPHPDYERTVLEGARERGLPDDYVDRYLRVPRV